MSTKVALAGATSKIGPVMLQSLLDTGFEVIILSRKGSNITDVLPKHERQTITKIDYEDVSDIAIALEGVEVLVSTLSSPIAQIQSALIDACVITGVKRFIPSEFALDLENPMSVAMPVYPGKVASHAYLKQVAEANPGFSYTRIYNGVWFDWGIKAGFIVNAKEHRATLWDGGDVLFSMTRQSTVGKAVVAVIKNQDATSNRAVYIHDLAITLNQLINIIKTIDGIEWTTQVRDSAESEKEGYEELDKPDHSAHKAMVSFQYRCAFGRDLSPDFSTKLDNELLGLRELKGEELVDAVRKCL